MTFIWEEEIGLQASYDIWGRSNRMNEKYEQPWSLEKAGTTKFIMEPICIVCAFCISGSFSLQSMWNIVYKVLIKYYVIWKGRKLLTNKVNRGRFIGEGSIREGWFYGVYVRRDVRNIPCKRVFQVIRKLQIRNEVFTGSSNQNWWPHLPKAVSRPETFWELQHLATGIPCLEFFTGTGWNYV